MSRKRVLVVGGTGYLGQHVLQGFSDIKRHTQFDLAFTHFSVPPPQVLLDALPHLLAFNVDLKTGLGFQAISDSFGQPDIVVNCAALSVPRACEVDPPAAMSINVPSSLVKWLSSFGVNSTLLIHLSTDQDCDRSGFLSVYEGVKSFYKEEDVAIPVNVYGKSKIAAEKFISENCSNFAILRSSIIFGPQTISPVPKSLPSDGKKLQLLLNVGGPDRVSRVQMAETVADLGGYNKSLIKSVSASLEPQQQNENPHSFLNVFGLKKKKKTTQTEAASKSSSTSDSGSGGDSFNEFMAYLSEGLVVDGTAESFDLVQWWRARSLTWPILTRLTMNIFSISVSTISSEQAFSMTRRILEERRNALQKDIVEALVCIKDWDRADQRLQDTISPASQEWIDEFN
ncbi:Putative AC transposase [Morus notabilis]|uniref:Putative AC transposase n=1 Tax=Morus notabilis TaxID=981085 RepID=W9RX76_9ROSA|nr:Putative AC transposase [Morus notabilis]